MKENKKLQLYILVSLVLIITVLHYFTSNHEVKLHALYKRLYYIPIILAAFQFRIKGGVILPIVISILYLPYLWFFSGHSSIDLITNLFEIIMFYTVGSITGLLVEKLHLNLEEIKHLHEQVRRADKLSAVGQLASGVAHEIRNPLAIINTVSQTLMEEAQGKDEKEALEIIQEEVNRANKVIKELLDFSKLEKVIKAKVEVQDILHNVILLTNKYAQKKGVEIIFERIPELTHIYGDIEKLKQAFVNIIFNAVDAIQESGTIYVRLEKQQDEIEIIFEDTGKGILKENIEKIFDPFFTTKDTGVGLGLAITYRIIDEHGGNISIRSIENKGTKVKVELPLLKEEDL